MKKSVIGFLLSILGLAWANAQSVDNYKFVSSTGTYAALSGGTELTQIPSDGSDVAAFVYDATTKITIDKDNNPGQRTISGIDMGFDFMLGGETFRKFAVTGYGYVLLGKADTDIEFTAWDFYMNRMDGISTAVGIGTDVSVYGLGVTYAVTGGEGSHVLTVQFSGISYQDADAAADARMNYQIKFYEADNHVEMIFAGYGGISSFDGNRFNLGLVAGGKRHFRRSGSDWTATSYESSTTTMCWSVPGFPAGLNYTFSLPDPCAMPDYRISELKLTPKSDEVVIDIHIDTTSGSAEGYLVIVSTVPVTENPDGLNFVKGQEALGGTVLAVGDLSEFDPNRTNPDRSKAHIYFTHGNLQPNTLYYYTVYLSNTKSCLARYTAPVSQSVATATTAPARLSLVSISSGEAKFSAQANGLGEEIAILMTTGQGTDINGNRVYVGNFADIPSDAKVGDTFETSYTLMGSTVIDKTVVLYRGSASDDITFPLEVESNRMYYFGAVSQGKDNGFYSSEVANAEPYLSPAALPFADNFVLNLSAAEDNPFIGGWKDTRNFSASTSSRVVNGVISTMEAGVTSEAVLVMPPLDFPTDSNVLVNINYSLDPWNYNSSKVKGDSICLEISTDGGKTFTILKAVHNNTDNLTLGKVILSDYLGVKQAVLRLRAVSANPDKTWNINVSSIRITALPFCPEPGRAYVAETYGGTLALTWLAGENGETQWNISMAAEGDEGGLAWSRPSLVEEKPYYISGLGDLETYNVRVQAVCVGGRTSGWVESTVQAGRVPTFTEGFDNLQFEKDYYGVLQPQIPQFWQDGIYYVSSYSGPVISWYSGMVQWKNYRTDVGITEEMSGYDGAAAYDMDGTSGYLSLLVTPTVELNAAEKPEFVFDGAYGKLVDGVLNAVSDGDVKSDHKLVLWVCDSGRTVNVENEPFKIWTSDELITWNEGKTLKVDLSGYDGLVSICFGIYTTKGSGAGEYMLYLDNIGFVNMMPMARSVRVEALSGTSATIKWVADRTVSEWIVKLTGENMAAPEFYTTSGNRQVITGLDPETAYRVAVAYVYENEGRVDTVTWNSVDFVTPGLTCDAPMELRVSDISRKSAVLTWQGNAADGYRVRYRPVVESGAGQMDWVEVEVTGTTYMLNGLASETEYECGVQSVCSKIGQLESDFVAFGNFSTLALTCFEPTGMRILDLGANTVDVAWEGSSDAYQVAWTLQGANAWIYGEVINGTSYTIKGLNYDKPYSFMVRGVCAPGDSSEWSETRNFRTGSRPACADPANLRVEALTQTSATLLWEAEEAEEGDIQGYILRHRAASVQAWDSIKDVKGNTYAITDMEPKTAYVWAVMTVCIDDRYSENWAQLRFETPDTATQAVEDLNGKAGLSVFAAQGQIHVMNPLAIRIDNIRIFSTAGRRLETYTIRSYDNVILTTAVRKRVAVVEVEGDGGFHRFKVLLP